MEVAMALLSVVGTLASFYGAWLAWKQAGISKSAAELAGRIKEQLINHRRTSELSELQVHIESTKRTFFKYGSAKPSSLTGINHNADAEVALASLFISSNHCEIISLPQKEMLQMMLLTKSTQTLVSLNQLEAQKIYQILVNQF